MRFKKGEEKGSKKALEELKNKFVRASTQMFLYGIDLIRKLDGRGFPTEDFYVNPFGFKFLLVTSLENTHNEAFIESFFELSFQLQNRFKEEFDINALYLFVQNENLNISELKADGFLKITNEQP